MNPMPYNYCFHVSHKIICVVFVCLLLAKATIEDNSSYPVTSCTCPCNTPQPKYDVFVSFRGADVRKGFLSHLLEAFSLNHIAAFVDYNISKGDEISDALLGAIERSSVSLIIFSENYASSRWCLLELVKIVECRKKNRQIVVPIFYKVDPSYVRHQKGAYADAFAGHETKYGSTYVQTWRSALNESANLSGFPSSIFRDEAELIKEIVKCVSMKLNYVLQVNSKGLAGVDIVWQVARQKSIEDPRSQSRLLDPDDIYQVLKCVKGNEAIRGIVINLSRIKKLQLNPQVITKMSKLHFLDFYSKGSCGTFLQDQWGLYLLQELESLLNELRYLRWTHYPLESLPSKFSAENLAELNLPYSRVKKLRQVLDFVNLKVLILHSSIHLKELPDFSKATNLKVIDLRFCVGLTSVHPSIFSLKKLEKLDLGGCISLRSLRSNTHLESLRYLSLYGCMSLKDFSVTSKNLVKLNLELTSIKQLPSSIGLQSKLENLSLAYTYVESLPASIKHLTRLRHLDLRHCRELRTLLELPPSLETLDARGCVSLEIVMFPSSAIEQLKENKKRVAFWNCLKLDEHSLMAIELNAQINMMKFAHQHLSTFGDAQGTYVYPGSKVPAWLVHKTTQRDYVTIDLSCVFSPQSSHLGFIFGFVIPEVPYGGSVLEFKISTGDEGNQTNVYLDGPHHGIKSDHVYLMYDQACSRYLYSRAKHQPRLIIKVTVASRTLTSQYVPLRLGGFGVSTINTAQYLKFIQKIELGDSSIPNVSILFKFFWTFFIVVVFTWVFIRVRRFGMVMKKRVARKVRSTIQRWVSWWDYHRR